MLPTSWIMTLNMSLWSCWATSPAYHHNLQVLPLACAGSNFAEDCRFQFEAKIPCVETHSVPTTQGTSNISVSVCHQPCCFQLWGQWRPRWQSLQAGKVCSNKNYLKKGVATLFPKNTCSDQKTSRQVRSEKVKNSEWVQVEDARFVCVLPPLKGILWNKLWTSLLDVKYDVCMLWAGLSKHDHGIIITPSKITWT